MKTISIFYKLGYSTLSLQLDFNMIKDLSTVYNGVVLTLAENNKLDVSFDKYYDKYSGVYFFKDGTINIS